MKVSTLFMWLVAAIAFVGFVQLKVIGRAIVAWLMSYPIAKETLLLVQPFFRACFAL